MRYLNLLNEKVEYADLGNSRVKVYVNPRGDFLANITVELRWIIDDDTLYVWNSYEATHGQIAEALGIVEDISGYYNYENEPAWVECLGPDFEIVKGIFDKLNIPMKLNESIEFVEIYYNRKIKVFKNPKYSQIKNIEELRWIIDKNNIYLWDANDAIHYEIRSELGLENQSSPLGYYNTKSSDVCSYGDHTDSNESNLVNLNDSVFKQQILDIFQKYKYPIKYQEQDLTESVDYIDIKYKQFDNPITVMVFVNPPYSRIKNFRELRWFVDVFDNVYFWDSKYAIHSVVIEHYGFDNVDLYGMYFPTKGILEPYNYEKDNLQRLRDIFNKHRYEFTENLDTVRENKLNQIYYNQKQQCAVDESSERYKDVQIYLNPSKQEQIKLSQERELRWVYDTANSRIWVWRSHDLTHFDVVINYLLPKYYPDQLDLLDNGKSRVDFSDWNLASGYWDLAESHLGTYAKISMQNINDYDSYQKNISDRVMKTLKYITDIMRSKNKLHESFERLYGHSGYNLYINPSSSEWQSLRRLPKLRFIYLYRDNKFYIWDAFKATHYQTMENIKIYLDSEVFGKDYSFGWVNNIDCILRGTDYIALDKFRKKFSKDYEVTVI